MLGITGLDWFVSIAGGFSKLDDDNNKKIELASNPFKATVERVEAGKLPWIPASLGLSWNKGRLHTRLEVAGNVAAAASSADVKDLGQIKFTIGMQATDKLVISGLVGTQMWSVNKMHVKLSAPAILPKKSGGTKTGADLTDGGFYLSDKNENDGSVYSSRFRNFFGGVELKYQLKKHVYLIGSGQFGLNQTKDKKDLYLIASQDINKASGSKHAKGVLFPNSNISEVVSRMKYKFSVGLLIESGGIL